jgi:putative aldouronate transport system substrate-binding protein
MNDADASLYASDGQMYQIGNLIAQGVNHTANDYINQAWLDAVGKEIPTTVEELTDVLIAFRDGDPNGNGVADEFPMSGGDLFNDTQGVYTHFSKFGVPLHKDRYLTVDGDGKIQFHGYYEGFRAANEWLAMCYAEGLFDPESITQDSNVWATKVNAGNVGYTTYLRLLNTALTAEIIPNYVSILPPKSEFGVQVPRNLEVSTFGAALTMTNEYVPETLQWIDRQLETERMMVAYNGPIQPGGPIEPTMEINAEGRYNILSVPENNALYEIVPVWMAQFFAPADYYSDVYEMPPHRVERFNTSKDYEAGGVLEPGSFDIVRYVLKPSNEDGIEAQRIYVELDKLMQESISNFITGGVTDANWDAFLAACENIGVQQYIDIYQKAYDAYAANA